MTESGRHRELQGTEPVEEPLAPDQPPAAYYASLSSSDGVREQMKALLRRSPEDQESAPIHHPPDDDLPAPRGHEFESRYERREVLGDGAMGEVLCCTDHWIGRDVAVKTMLPDDVGVGDLEARFIREIRVQGQLEHPGIVPVYDTGRNDKDAAYFTMRKVKGPTLGDIFWRIREGSVVTRQTYSRFRLLTAFTQLCQAMQYAHSRGVIHRDLKPSNIMLGEFGAVYILDWGLAKIRANVDHSQGVRPGEEEEGLTVVGSVMGTPGYMSPEQARGENEALDHRTDIYALGAIFYEIVTNVPLHRGQTSADVMRSTLKGVDVATSVRENNAEVPEALVSIAAKATQMDPNERYATVGDMEQAIVAYLEGSREESRRQELAEQKAQEARKLLEGEGGQETLAESRMKALSAVGRALALDSANADARELFITLLTERNRYVPAAAKEGLQAMRRRAYNIAVYAGAQGYASVAACFLLYALCIEDPRSWLAWGAASLWAACAGLTLLVSKHLKGYERLPYLLLVLANGAILVSSLVAGAVQLVPMFVLANVTNVILGAPPERRKPAAFLAMMTLLGPLLAEGVGLLPEPLTKSSNPISALTSMGIGPHLLSLVFSLTIHGVVLMTTMSFVGTLRRHLSDLEARMYLQSWQLRRLFGPELKNED